MEKQGPVWLSLLKQFKTGQHVWNSGHSTGKGSDLWETGNRCMRAWEPPAYGLAWEGGLWLKEESQATPEALPEGRRWRWKKRATKATGIHNPRRQSHTREDAREPQSCPKSRAEEQSPHAREETIYGPRKNHPHGGEETIPATKGGRL